MATHVFLSYRRADSADITWRIRDHLSRTFGSDNIFIDVDDIPPGTYFQQYIQQILQSTQVLLVIIGPNWQNATFQFGPKKGIKRLFDPHDFVRIEIETAFQLHVPVVPILVNQAHIPVAEELPLSLRRLPLLNSVQISQDKDFPLKIKRIEEAIVQVENWRAPQSVLPSSPEKETQTELLHFHYQQLMRNAIGGDLFENEVSELAKTHYPSWILLAEQGDLEALWLLAFCAEKGIRTPRDVERAVTLYRETAELGLAMGKVAMGRCYWEGIGLTANIATARAWFERASIQDCAQAYWNLYLLYDSGSGVAQDPFLSLNCLEKSAQLGLVDAQVVLAFHHREDNNPDRDWEQATFWMEQAAMGGDPENQFRAGMFYELNDGRGPVKDKMVEWYTRAVNQNHLDAIYRLGRCYDEGKGVALDPIMAVRLFRKGANLGEPGCQYKLGFCYRSGVGLPRDIDEAIKWYEKAAEQEYPNALSELGALYENGEGKPRDWKKAFSLYQRAANQNPVAQFRIGLFYEKGWEVEQDLATAVYWYQEAAPYDAEAKYRLALCYLNGKGVEMDAVRAFELLRQSATGDCAKAMFLLGLICLNQAIEAERDWVKRWTGFHWILTAAEEWNYSPAIDFLIHYRTMPYPYELIED